MRNGFRTAPKIETVSDYADKVRRSRKVTVGEVEDMINGAFLAMREFTTEMLARTDALAKHTGYEPPKNEQEARIEAVMDAQKQGIDAE